MSRKKSALHEYPSFFNPFNEGETTDIPFGRVFIYYCHPKKKRKQNKTDLCFVCFIIGMTDKFPLSKITTMLPIINHYPTHNDIEVNKPSPRKSINRDNSLTYKEKSPLNNKCKLYKIKFTSLWLKSTGTQGKIKQYYIWWVFLKKKFQMSKNIKHKNKITICAVPQLPLIKIFDYFDSIVTTWLSCELAK